MTATTPQVRRLLAAFVEAPVAMAVQSAEGRLLHVNRGLCQLAGRSERDLLGLALDDLIDRRDRESMRTMRTLLLGGDAPPAGRESRLRRPDGSCVDVRLSFSVVGAVNGDPAYLVCHLQDIGPSKAREATLAHQAMHDYLTGLPNRQLLMDRLTRALARSARAPGSVALLFLDLDGFKAVNDGYGHRTGDELLEVVARRLQMVMRPGDTVARFGGDEFVILCEDNGAIQAQGVARRAMAVIAEPFDLEAAPVTVSASIGIAVSHQPEDTAEELIRDADRAMYDGKQRLGSRPGTLDINHLGPAAVPEARQP